MPMPPPGGAGAGGPPPPGAGAGPPQPPIGSSPATGPTQNLGNAAKANQAVGALLKGMALAMALAGPGTPLGQALNKSISDIGKHLPPGASSPQGEGNFEKEMVQRRMQMTPHLAALSAQGGGGAPPGAPPPPPGGAPPPMPAG